MALESRYDWNSAPPGARSWIKPWMIVALILSGGVHAGLYIWFQQVVVPREESPTRSAIESLKDLRVQLVINESTKYACRRWRAAAKLDPSTSILSRSGT